MECENCKSQHEGAFGSGRFCSQACASSWATKAKRQEINASVSKALKGRKPVNLDNCFQPGFDPRRRQFGAPDRIKAVQANAAKRAAFYQKASWDELPRAEKRRRVLNEQKGVCIECNLGGIWNGKPFTFELDHINGNAFDDRRENLRMLCPLCHSQTKNYRSKNYGRGRRKRRRGEVVE